MADWPEKLEITDRTEIEIEPSNISSDEREWLTEAGVVNVKGYREEEITTIVIDFDRLSQIAFEYELLDSVASRVEVDVLRYFRQSDQTTHTTAEISAGTDRAKSSVSRALSRLVDKGYLTKVQSGVYRYKRRMRS